MIRHAKLLLAALLVAFSVASVAEAAPKRVVRHRPKHSTRVSSGAAATAGTSSGAPRRKATAKKKVRVGASRAAGSRVAAKKKATARASATTVRRRPATKPR
jgi:hypothetical protein